MYPSGLFGGVSNIPLVFEISNLPPLTSTRKLYYNPIIISVLMLHNMRAVHVVDMMSELERCGDKVVGASWMLQSMELEPGCAIPSGKPGI